MSLCLFLTPCYCSTALMNHEKKCLFLKTLPRDNFTKGARILEEGVMPFHSFKPLGQPIATSVHTQQQTPPNASPVQREQTLDYFVDLLDDFNLPFFDDSATPQFDPPYNQPDSDAVPTTLGLPLQPAPRSPKTLLPYCRINYTSEERFKKY